MTKAHDPTCRDKFIAHKANYRQALYDGVKRQPATPKEIHDEAARQHPIGAQFSRFQSVKPRMLEWRNEDLPPKPKFIRDVQPILPQYQWKSAITYEVTIADELSETIEKSVHELQAWAVSSGAGDREATHVVLGYPTYANDFQDDTSAFADSTFEVVPNVVGCYQLFTIMIEHGEEVFPACYVLMQSKDEEAYAAVLETIKTNLLPNFSPTSIMADFEAAQSNALQAIFPEAAMHGCFFHHCQAIRKYAQQSKIDANVATLSPTHIAEFSAYKRDLMNLALLPQDLIAEAFEDLVDRLSCNIVLWDISHGLLSYYEDFWLGQKGVAAFSVYGEKRRTNNVLERYHRSLREKIATRPEFYKFMNHIFYARSVGVIPGFPHNLQQSPNYVIAKPIARPTAYHPHHPTPQHHYPTNTHTLQLIGRVPYISVGDIGGVGHHQGVLHTGTPTSFPRGMQPGMNDLSIIPPGSGFPWSTSPRGRPRKGMMRRAVFSDTQRKGLEKRFIHQKYISKPDRKKLAEKLGLKDSQVKIWFQNRRMKWRNNKERQLLANGGSREQTLPNKNNPHPDLSDVDGERPRKDLDDLSPLTSPKRSPDNTDNEDEEEINVT